MRPLYVLSLFMLVMIPACSIHKVEVSGVLLREAIDRNEISLNDLNYKNIKLLERLIILPEGDYDENSVKEMIHRIGNIHPNILSDLLFNQVKIKLFNGKLTDEEPFSHLKGVQPRGWTSGKTWDDVPGAGGSYVAAAKIGSSEPGQGHSSINLELHEIAHSFEKKAYGKIRYKVDFRHIWIEEAPVLFPNKQYFISYPEEFFAECFAMYYLNEETRKKLKKKAPKTYEYLKNIEKNANK